MKKILALTLVLLMFTLCACSNSTDADTATKATKNDTQATTEEKPVSSSASNMDGTFIVTLDSYIYDFDADTVTITIENISDSVEYTCSEQVMLEMFDNSTGTYASVGDDQLYDDMLYFLTPQTKETLTFKLNDKFPEFTPTDGAQYRLGFMVENNSGDSETVYALIDLK